MATPNVNAEKPYEIIDYPYIQLKYSGRLGKILDRGEFLEIMREYERQKRQKKRRQKKTI
jgi:hypothetical protein